jgi:hypothetical protein
MKVFEVFEHSVVQGVTEFFNESNKIILEHTAPKILLIPITTFSHSCKVLPHLSQVWNVS